MNLMMAIMPTTLLGVLPVGLLLVRGGSTVSYTHLAAFRNKAGRQPEKGSGSQ